MKIKTILLPHDGEQMSDRAFMYALEFAKALGSEIILLHVIDEIEIPAGLLLGKDRVVIERVRRDTARDIKQKWSKFADEKIRLFSSEGAKVSAEIRAGDPAEQILNFAKEKDADIIVMGSRRLEGTSKFILALGSVARKISERAYCPVMLVR